jgi:hypothetical protein
VAWRFDYSAESTARPDVVWQLYLDVDHWCEWSKQGVEWSRIDGPFAVGTKGKSKPPGFRPLRFTLVTVEPNERFASEVKMPGVRMRFGHVVEPSASGGSRITHSVALDGPLAFLFRPLVRKSVERGLPEGVDRLAAMSAGRR